MSLSNKAQVNLVPNYSFEDTLGACQSQMIIFSSVSKAKYWYTCFAGSSVDYYNVCANSFSYPTICSVPYSCRTYQQPLTGNAFVGLWMYEVTNSSDSASIYSEDVAVKINKPLDSGKCYYAEFYANLGNSSTIAINQISMLLSQTIYTTTTGVFNNTIQPQIQWDTTKYFKDTLNWVKISGTFITQGGEEYLTIGNFKDGNYLKKTAISNNFIPGGCGLVGVYRNYLLIDDVSLYELPNHNGTQSYTLCAGDSLILGDTVSLPIR